MKYCIRIGEICALLIMVGNVNAQNVGPGWPPTVELDGRNYNILNDGNAPEHFEEFLGNNFSQDGMFEGTRYFKQVRTVAGNPLYAETVFEIIQGPEFLLIRELEATEVAELRGQPLADGGALRGYGDAILWMGTEVENRVNSNAIARAFVPDFPSRARMNVPGNVESREEMCEILKDNRVTQDWSVGSLDLTSAQMACFAYAGADLSANQEAHTAESRNDAALSTAALTNGASQIASIGEQTINGRNAQGFVHLSANVVHPIDGGEVAIDRMGFWIDTEKHVLLKMRSEGIMRQNGEERAIFIERENTDFRNVANSRMYMPYRETLRMGGVLGPEERAQMAEAQQKMAEFEQQMASMPASQRQMMENMMGGQLAQMRSLVNTGAIEIVFETTEIVANPDFSADSAVAQVAPSAAPPNLLIAIQQNLQVLGYDPGNTTGDLTRPTVVAITQFQVDKGMEITGQPSPQVLGATQAAVDAM